MDKDLMQSWYEMPVSVQISNIGSEVNRAIRWKDKGKTERQISFCNKAIEFLEIIITDPKNQHRKREFEFCIEELRDFFLGENMYNTTNEMLIKYYDAFL